MSRTIVLQAATAAEALYALLTDPRRRPEWQSSLRRVEHLTGTGDVGSNWLDVTMVGARPRMWVRAAEPPRRWAESGRWHGLRADLDLRLEPLGDDHTELTATFAVRGGGLWALPARLLELLAGPAITADLRRAIALAG